MLMMMMILCVVSLFSAQVVHLPRGVVALVVHVAVPVCSCPVIA